MPYENLVVDRGGSIATIVINRPRRLNALSVDTIREMMVALGEANADPDVRVVVITGAGDAFSAGADLKDAPDPMTPEVAHQVRPMRWASWASMGSPVISSSQARP